MKEHLGMCPISDGALKSEFYEAQRPQTGHFHESGTCLLIQDRSTINIRHTGVVEYL